MEREHDDSPLREAGKAQAGDEEFENFWCRKGSVLAIRSQDRHRHSFGTASAAPRRTDDLERQPRRAVDHQSNG
jgi:hypothetical protein